MTGIQERLATGKGKFTPNFPELGTAPVDYEDSISQEFFEAEREAVFRRSWLKVGRIEQLPKRGGYFTRDLPGLGSIVVVRSTDDTVRALHNVCAHRGNKLVWQEHPQEESQGTCRAFTCKYHGWRYGLDGKIAHITNEDQFFDLDKSGLRMPPLHCEVFAGFIFVNFGKDAEPLRSFLGERLLELESYPFGEMTQRFGYRTRIKGNWKLSIDAVLEWYHPPYVHARFIDPDVGKAEKLVPPVDAYHYDIFDPHMLTSVPGPSPLPPREPGELGPVQRNQKWIYRLFRAGLFGPDDVPDVGPLPEALNKGDIRSWGNDSFWLFPNFSVQIWARNFYITYQYWPEAVDSHTYELNIYFPPPENAQQRLAQELVADSTIEFAMQDSNTVEATHSALATRANQQFHLSDQELLIRNFHKVIRDAVDAHQSAEKEEDHR
ncbi:aromatic ring-hydroxylating dioxygenase subunit alpha [Streptomyces sp. PSKA54]|uniref:Aromatic ring-hydroxylating dioxygenase subunit alpha n=1 Tax=Streptomyces himalayensis subsp. aureolus TaxID=2758039 RepID=A0A7W2HH40_9ACTN|nr:aromatic ring-hydroxylating dioxygenase subunit alpha [Streptomyces himalayensis]MBA4863608.1 aromatic ring-hydroxylating dioxygenase subunit alpha [Streptomyces himalayensis subsp. aureolus]